VKADREKLLESRRTTARATQDGDILYDPIEDDARYTQLIRAAEAEAEMLLEGLDFGMGFCQLLWGTKQDLLKDQHDLVWFTPAEMNPDILFD
jgi:hypothetical protein